MATDDMRSGFCSLCGGDEVHEAEMAGQLGLRKPGGLLMKVNVFTVLVCTGCGHLQWHVPMDEERRDWLRRKTPGCGPGRRSADRSGPPQGERGS
ncbi:hypothetical protein ACH4LN_19640 [Streptomyces albus]|uniref:hypothetical protein n=1 Tax=Streptomyces TaxID=1883 RepID=UPI0004C73DE0|nr:hypothetical protein [Streptomyces sp. NRRL F-5639]KPC95497.1 hypothetical protein ADL27_08400 [Streptomyces sp. NRRL F-6602]